MTERKTVQDIRRDFLTRLSNVRQAGKGWKASCPVPGHGQGRGDKNPSLDVDEAEDKLLIDCKAGCSPERVVEAIGWTMADLFVRDGRVVNLSAVRGERAKEGCTLEAYAEKTGLPVEFLEEELGLEQAKYQGRVFVKIPYYDVDGTFFPPS